MGTFESTVVEGISSTLPLDIALFEMKLISVIDKNLVKRNTLGFSDSMQLK